MERKINYFNSAVTEAKALVSNKPCDLESLVLSNAHTAATFCQIFNAAATADVTVGTTVAVRSMAVPAGGSLVIQNPCLYLSKGCVIAFTAGVANGTAPGAAGVANIALSQA